MYTLDDYNEAKAELEALHRKWENYSSNNPNKFRAEITSTESKVRLIEAALKACGLLPRTPQEQLDADLDAAFPKARSREIVELNGKRYIRRFVLASKSLSGKTKKWDGYREEEAK